MALTISSTAFAHSGPIPRRYACEGADISLVLEWSGVPRGATSLVRIVDDPDAADPKAPQ